MDRAAEHLGRLLTRLVSAKWLVVWLFAVPGPVPLDLPCRGIDHDDATILVTVGDVRLIGLRIDDNLGWRAKVQRVVAASAFAGVTILRDKFSVFRKL